MLRVAFTSLSPFSVSLSPALSLACSLIRSHLCSIFFTRSLRCCQALSLSLAHMHSHFPRLPYELHLRSCFSFNSSNMPICLSLPLSPIFLETDQDRSHVKLMKGVYPLSFLLQLQFLSVIMLFFSLSLFFKSLKHGSDQVWLSLPLGYSCQAF